MANLTDFQAILSKGPTTNNRFTIEIPSNGTGISTRDINFHCYSVTMPGRRLDTTSRTIGMITQQMPNGISFEPVEMSFYLTNDYAIRKFFDKWQESVCYNEGFYELNYKEDYTKTVNIHHLDKNDNKIRSVQLRWAYPIQISAQSLNNESTNEVMRMSVTLDYAEWISI